MQKVSKIAHKKRKVNKKWVVSNLNDISQGIIIYASLQNNKRLKSDTSNNDRRKRDSG